MGFIALACFMPCVVTSALVHVGRTSETTWTMFMPKLIFLERSYQWLDDSFKQKNTVRGEEILQIHSYATGDRYNRLM